MYQYVNVIKYKCATGCAKLRKVHKLILNQEYHLKVILYLCFFVVLLNRSFLQSQ
jgi:hypothetical protein